MRTAIYIRVSTEEQAKEGYSISAQRQKLKAFCIAQDWDIEGLYADEGVSAKDTNRPQLQRMLKDIEQGKIDCVLVYRLDRLTRSVLDLYKLLEIFEKHDCKFKSATEVYDTTTAMGRMFITIVAALAQWERENLGERISFGFAEKARQGKYPLNFRPIGYDLNLKTGELTINEEEAKIIKLIYDLYLDGYSANRLCRYLNDHGIKTKGNNAWNDKPLMQILKNPLYYGSIRWKDMVIENTHEPIISKETFELVQQTIKTRYNTEPRRLSSGYIFTGKVKCYKCGNAMTGYYVNGTLASGEKVIYKQYRCLKKKTGECKGARSISERKLEDAFIDYLVRTDFSYLFDEVASTPINTKTINKSNVEKEILINELEKIERRKKKWQYAWAEDDSVMSFEDFKKRMEEANAEEKRIKDQLVQYEEVETFEEFSNDEIIAGLKNIRKNWNVLTIEEKKNTIGPIIKRINYDFDEKSQLYIESIDFY